MTRNLSLSEIKAFAEVYGFKVLQGHGATYHLYTIGREVGSNVLPLCPYMEPELLVLWLDGYRAGLKAPNP